LGSAPSHEQHLVSLLAGSTWKAYAVTRAGMYTFQCTASARTDVVLQQGSGKKGDAGRTSKQRHGRPLTPLHRCQGQGRGGSGEELECSSAPKVKYCCLVAQVALAVSGAWPSLQTLGHPNADWLTSKAGATGWQASEMEVRTLSAPGTPPHTPLRPPNRPSPPPSLVRQRCEPVRPWKWQVRHFIFILFQASKRYRASSARMQKRPPTACSTNGRKEDTHRNLLKTDLAAFEA